jgi:hypothetical protein
MAKKPYSPITPYGDLKEVEKLLQTAATADDVRKLVVKHGPKVGYKAFCFMLGGKMSAAAMRPDEACIEAARLEQQGDAEGATAIYKEIVAFHPDHPIAAEKMRNSS